jgi:hypothetical protein
VKTILDQQIELELGDEYPEALERARKFVGATLNMYKRWNKTQIILDGEGGRAGVLRNCLATIVEVGDISEGLDRWATRLAVEYANGAHTKWATLDLEHTELDDTNHLVNDNDGAPIPQDHVGIDVRPVIGYTTLGYSSKVMLADDFLDSLLGESSSEKELSATSSSGVGDDEKPDMELVIKSAEERELYEALSATQNLEDAAELIGMDYGQAKVLNNRVWQRVRYHYGRRGHRFSSTNG